MNYLKKIFFAISASILLLSLIILVVEIRTNKALNDYSMFPDGVKVVDKVILGRRERTLSKGLRQAYFNEFSDGFFRVFRQGGISLICTNQKNILLIVQSYKPTRHGLAGGIGKGEFRGYSDLSGKNGQIDISNMTYLSRGYFDTYVSDPLSRQEINSILEILKIEGLTQIGIIAFDGGDAFISKFKLSEVKQIVNNCQ